MSGRRPGATALRLLAFTALLHTGATAASGTAESLTSATFDVALQSARQMPRLHSVLVSQDDTLIVEEYFNGRRPSDSANVKSVSKSIMSALVGIAISQGHIESVDQPIVDYERLIDAGQDPRKRAITVGNLLSMQAGLETTSFYNYGAWVLSDDWVRFALEQPMIAEPGTRLLYSTGNTHLLSAIITEATGGSTWQFAREQLARPLGFDLPAWPQDPKGIYFGGNNMELTPRQMLEFGRLYLNRGSVDGRQLIPADWIDLSLTPRAESSRESGRYYGLGWWIKSMAGFDAPYAWGYGGQFIMLIPELELVVVTTSSSEPGAGRRQHIRSLYDLIEAHIVRPAAGALIRPPLAPATRTRTAQPSGD